MWDSLNLVLKSLLNRGESPILALLLIFLCVALYIVYVMYKCIVKKDAQIEALNTLLFQTIQKAHHEIAELIQKQVESNDELIDKIYEVEKVLIEVAVHVKR